MDSTPRYFMAVPRVRSHGILFALAVLILSGGASPAQEAGAASRPNIVIVMTDDQGYGDLGVTGNTVLETPHIDRLARESASLRYFYVSPVCSPTRASLLTGRYNYRTRAIDTWVGRSMMEPTEVTMAEILKGAGYLTGIFGKWHLGDCYPMRPGDQGFDESLVLRGGGLAQPSEPLENERRYTDPILYRSGEEVHTRGYCTDVYFDEAIAFMRRARSSGRPFFAYIPTNAPHSPFHDVPEALYEKYRKRDIASLLKGSARGADSVARIFAMIENIDQNIGRLLAELESLEIARDTIVVFFHDNGPQIARYVGEMRGTKTEVYEGGIRSPLFVRWPARLKAGTVVSRVGAHIDLLPTLLEAARVPLPAGLRIDGRSLLPLLGGRSTEWPERTIYLQAHRGDAPIRYHNFAARGSRWKLLRASGFGKETPPANAPFELYDLSSDPREENNLAARHPEIVARMKADYDRWFDDVSSTRPGNYAPPRIIVGSDHETTTSLTRQDWRRLAGDGWGTDGQWLLKFEGDHEYDVRVIAAEEMPEGSITLTAGSVRRVKQSSPGKSFELSSVRIPAGDASLRVAVSAGGKTVGPYQVIVTRR